MRNINGYIFIASFGEEAEIKHMFGPGKKRQYCNLRLNNITPFEGFEEAKQVGGIYEGELREIKEIHIGKLTMEIAERDIEFAYFEDKSDLIAIMKTEELDYVQHTFVGPVIGDMSSLSPLPCAPLEENNFTTYNNNNTQSSTTPFKRAEYAAQEMHRQGQTPATIATFSLEKIEKL